VSRPIAHAANDARVGEVDEQAPAGVGKSTPVGRFVERYVVLVFGSTPSIALQRAASGKVASLSSTRRSSLVVAALIMYLAVAPLWPAANAGAKASARSRDSSRSADVDRHRWYAPQLITTYQYVAAASDATQAERQTGAPLARVP
jgi:hypothetical protein